MEKTNEKVVGFDIEIGDVFQNFSQWRDYRPLHLTCVGLAPSDAEPEAIFEEGEDYLTTKTGQRVVYKLEQYVKAGYKIITWNGLAFDFVLLADTSEMFDVCKTIALGPQHVDIMFNMFMVLGYGVGLGTVCKETIGAGKLMGGAHAPVAWKEGDRESVLAYVREDAVLVKNLYQHLAGQRVPIKWRTRRGYGVLKQMHAGRLWAHTWSVRDMLEKAPPPPLASFMGDRAPTMQTFLGAWNDD